MEPTRTPRVRGERRSLHAAVEGGGRRAAVEGTRSERRPGRCWGERCWGERRCGERCRKDRSRQRQGQASRSGPGRRRVQPVVRDQGPRGGERRAHEEDRQERSHPEQHADALRRSLRGRRAGRRGSQWRRRISTSLVVLSFLPSRILIRFALRESRAGFTTLSVT